MPADSRTCSLICCVGLKKVPSPKPIQCSHPTNISMAFVNKVPPVEPYGCWIGPRPLPLLLFGPFLRSTIMGVPEHTIRVIMACISINPTLVVRDSGLELDIRTHTKALRKGGPLSAHLFSFALTYLFSTMSNLHFVLDVLTYREFFLLIFLYGT